MSPLSPQAHFRLLSRLGLVPLAGLVYCLLVGAWLAAAGALLVYLLLSLPLFSLARALQQQEDTVTSASEEWRNR